MRSPTGGIGSNQYTSTPVSFTAELRAQTSATRFAVQRVFDDPVSVAWDRVRELDDTTDPVRVFATIRDTLRDHAAVQHTKSGRAVVSGTTLGFPPPPAEKSPFPGYFSPDGNPPEPCEVNPDRFLLAHDVDVDLVSAKAVQIITEGLQPDVSVFKQGDYWWVGDGHHGLVAAWLCSRPINLWTWTKGSDWIARPHLGPIRQHHNAFGRLTGTV